MINVTVTSVSARSAGEETDVTFLVSDGAGRSERSTFTLSARQFLTLGVAKGESDTEMFDAVSRASEVWSATKKGMMLLGYGAVSEKAMCMKLAAKGFDREIAKEAVKALVSLGLMNGADDASELARKLVTKLWGKKRIIAGLYEKGYSSEAVADAMNTLEDMEIDFAQNCRTLIEKRYGGVPSDALSQRKLFAALSRYGYSSSEIKEALSKKE